MSPRIELRQINKHFGPMHVINNVNLTVEEREFVVFLGQSGCGKTTTLRAIAGLETIDSGEIRIAGKPVQDTRPEERDIAFVFQSFALYPHLTVYENMAFPLRATRTPRDEVDRTVRRVAEVLQTSHLLKRRPSALSGGDLQRVAIGRALVRNPKAMLMDEPIGSLDAKLREEMRVELKRLHVEQGSTTIYVTHDQIEAMTMADRIVVMRDGRIEQVGTPIELYDTPANTFVATFIGSPAMNLIPGTIAVSDGRAHLRDSKGETAWPLPDAAASLGVGRPVVLGVRPESFLVDPQGVATTVVVTEPTGAETHVVMETGDVQVTGIFRERRSYRPGETLHVTAVPGSTHLFDPDSGARFSIDAAA